MPERKKQLTAKLDELDEHIESSNPIDATVDAPLQQVLGNLRVAVDDEESDVEKLGIVDELGDIALSLEVSHPKLTEILNHISELLAGAGL